MTNKAIKITEEEQAYLAELAIREASEVKAMPMMKQLVLNEDSVNDKGEKVEPHTWNIRGENTYAEAVEFQPIYYKQKFIRMEKDGKKWKTTNESIFVNMPWDNAYDSNGTMSCGRIVGKTPDNWTEAQKDANFKKATIYGFLFGMVTFPGSKPELVNFRAAPGKAKVIRAAIESLADTKLYRVPFTLKLNPPPKGERFSTLTIDTQLNKVKDSIGDIIPYMKECDSFIEAHNARIMERRKNFESRMSGAQVYADVKSLAADFEDLEDEAYVGKGVKY